MKTIKRIVLTGGPCSGKSTFMTLAQQIFPKYGYQVMIDHEAATDLITGGISPATMGMYQFQKYCIGLQLKKEELFLQAAEEIKAEKVLVFFDRGILDDRGYVTGEEFTEILSDFDVKEEELPDRYDLVLHLTTSAKGSAAAYTLANNEARYEDVDGACRVDDSTCESWDVHSNRVIIKEEDDFHVKMDNAINAVLSFLGEK